MIDLFTRRARPALVGVLHLPALPGAPLGSDGLQAVLARALQDTAALVEGGAQGVVVENLGDAPFAAEHVEPITLTMMTRVAMAVREAAPDLALGINVLRNDALGALAVASAVGAQFVRVNVLTGVMATDQGLVQGRAREVALARARWAQGVSVAADVLVKHAAPLGPADIADVADDTFRRARADALIVTGTGTGRPASSHDVARVRERLPEAPLWLGSGMTPETPREVLEVLDVAIVGTWLHQDGTLAAPLDVERIAAVASALAR